MGGGLGKILDVDMRYRNVPKCFDSDVSRGGEAVWIHGVQTDYIII